MKVKLNHVRVAFTDLFEAVKIGDDPKSKPKFAAVLIVVPGSENAKAMAAAVKGTAAEKWKDKSAAVLKKLKEENRLSYKEGPKTNKTGDVYDGFEGMYHANTSNAARPLVIDRNKSPLTAQDGKVYAGCYVNATVDVWAQDDKRWGQRINVTLLGVQFDEDGDAFTAGARPDPEDFDDLGEGSQAGAELA